MDDPHSREAKRKNNPLHGSFLSRFTTLSNWVLNNRKQLPKMDKLSQKIIPLLYEQSSGGSGKVCKGFASHSSSTSCDTAHAQAVGWANLNTRTMFKSAKPGSGLLNREAGNCTRKVTFLLLYSVLQPTTSSDSDHHDLSTAVLKWLSHPQITALIAEVEAIFSNIFQSQQLTAPHPKPKPPRIQFFIDISGCDLQQL